MVLTKTKLNRNRSIRYKMLSAFINNPNFQDRARINKNIHTLKLIQVNWGEMNKEIKNFYKVMKWYRT